MSEDQGVPSATNSKSRVSTPLIISYNISFVLLCLLAGMFFWHESEMKSLKAGNETAIATQLAVKNSLQEMLEFQQKQKKEIENLQGQIVAMAVAVDEMDKTRTDKTLKAMIALYDDFDKRTKGFVSWATATEKQTSDNVAIFNRNVEVYNKKIATLEANVNYLAGEVEKHKNALLLILKR